ncbi:MAG TPA: hypothetical protein VFX12_05655 [Vicinamibacterales bacterium]|nr:hypothetical protein [Vicinamibacterales bacterium]
MRHSVVRGAGLLLTIAYASAIGWIYARQPTSAAQVSGGLASLIHAYHVDPQAFDDGVRFFHQDQFEPARAALARADPAQRDARTQFYIAYTFYRQGWGRVHTDAALYQQGLQAIDRAIASAPGGRVIVDDPQIQMHSGDELRAELARGITHPIHPLDLFGTRK